MITTILAFDPGGTTGVCDITFDSSGGRSCQLHQLGPEEHHLQLSQLIKGFVYNVDRLFIVCERFEYRAHSKAGLRLDSREYIGVIKQAAQELSLPVVMQSAAQAKGFVSNEHIKRAGLYRTSYRHAMDAVRHAIYFLVNNADYNKVMLDYEAKLRHDMLKNVYK